MGEKCILIPVFILFIIPSLFLSCDGNVYNELLAPACTVLYNDNGSTSGTVPSGPVTYKPGDVISVLDNTGMLQKAGFTFMGWNTANDGSGTTYNAGQKFIMGKATVRLYALWRATVAFDANGGTGTMAPLDIYCNAYRVLTAGTFTRTSYHFTGWATTSTATAIEYNDQASYLMKDGNVTLYAIWSGDLYQITFNANSATSGTMAAQSIAYNTTAAINTNQFLKDYYTFIGWSTTSSGPSVNYANGANFTMNVTGINLYAVWQGTITFNANGGTGSMANQNIIYNASAGLTANGFSRAGYTFSGWATSSGGTTAAYADQASYTMTTGSVTLYAVWGRTVTYYGNGSTAGSVPVDSIVYAAGDTVTVLGNVNDLRGPAIQDDITQRFTGWNTSADGTGTSYAEGDVLPGTGSVILYAQWTTTPTVPGKIGPAGGYVFYDNGSYTGSPSWRYMEAGPADLGYASWAHSEDNLITSTAIGTGYSNTQAILAQYPTTTDIGAYLCSVYSLNGYSDWFLPSSLELQEIADKLYTKGLGNFIVVTYESSSQNNTLYCYYVGFQAGPTWYSYVGGKDYSGACIRPARRF